MATAFFSIFNVLDVYHTVAINRVDITKLIFLQEFGITIINSAFS